jgi:excisionase family DNA binding protein
MTDLPNKTLLRPDEVAAYLSVSVKTLYGWIATGKIDAVRIGPSRLLRIKREVAENMNPPAVQ